jgi:hypothetical protein
MKGTATEVKGLVLLHEQHYDGDYEATYRHYRYTFACHVVNGEIHLYGQNGDNVPGSTWQFKNSVKTVRNYFSAKIASFPPSWHAKHAAIYAEER